MDTFRGRKAKETRGERERGSTVPFRDDGVDNLTGEFVCGGKARRGIHKWLSMLHFARCHRAALYAARVLVRANVSVTVADKRGVSDPHLAAPFFAPRPARRGRSRPTCMPRSSATMARCW